jgi:hypothetical protein
MQKLEALKNEAQAQLRRLESEGSNKGELVELKTYEIFRETLSSLLNQNPSPKMKSQIARYLVRWIKVHPDGVDINWAFGDDYIKCILASWNDSKMDKKQVLDIGQKKGAEVIDFSPEKKPPCGGSNTLTFGWGGRIRTSE